MTYDGRISKRKKGNGDIRAWPDNPLEKAGKIQATNWNGKKMFFRADVTPMADRGNRAPA